MNKTIWNTNLFFQIIEFVLIFFLWAVIPNPSFAHGFAIGFSVVFFIHQLLYALHCMVGLEYSDEGFLPGHIWFYYVFVPFATFYDSYEEAFERKPNLKKAFISQKEPIVIHDNDITVKKNDDGWTLMLKNNDNVMVILDDKHDPELLEALKKSVNENLIK